MADCTLYVFFIFLFYTFYAFLQTPIPYAVSDTFKTFFLQFIYISGALFKYFVNCYFSKTKSGEFNSGDLVNHLIILPL